MGNITPHSAAADLTRAFKNPRPRRSAGRVRGWRLGRRLSIPVAPRFLWECLTSPHHILVSIPCHLEPDVRFPLIRRSDSLLPVACTPLPSPTFTTSRSPYAGGACPERSRRVLHGCFPGSSPLPWPSLSLTNSAPSCSPCGANISTLQACPEPVEGTHFMLRAAASLPFLRGIHRFSTSGHPDARLASQARCLLRSLLVVTTTGLPPVSRR